MKLLKDYKMVAVVYLIITLVNVVWLVNYERPQTTSHVSNEKNVVLNA